MASFCRTISFSDRRFSSPLDEALLYHNPEQWGFVSLLYETRGLRLSAEAARAEIASFPVAREPSKALRATAYGSKRQLSFPLADLPATLERLIEQPDFGETNYWLAQAEFSQRNRRKVHLNRVSLLFVDIDYYNAPKYRLLEPEEMLEHVLGVCRRTGVPKPSIVLFSGRGLQLKWLHESLREGAYPRWAAAERFLVELFDRELGDGAVDTNCRDVSRVLRLCGSVNQKSGMQCGPLWWNDDFGEPRRYAFSSLCDAILPLTREELRRKRADRAHRAAARAHRRDQLALIEGGLSPNLRRFNVIEWSWVVVNDCRKLATLVPAHKRSEGWTNELVYHAASALALAVWGDGGSLRAELEALGHELAPHWAADRVDASVASVLQRVAQHRDGWRVLPRGTGFRLCSPDEVASMALDERRQLRTTLYTPKATTLIDWLEITEEQMRAAGLRGLVTPSVRRENQAESLRVSRRLVGVSHAALADSSSC